MYFCLYWILLCSFSLSSVNKDNKTLCQCCSLQLYYLRLYCRVSLCAIAPCRYSQRFRKSSDLLTQFQIQIQICRHSSRFQICRHNSRFQICRHNLRSLDTVPDLQTLSLDLYKQFSDLSTERGYRWQRFVTTQTTWITVLHVQKLILVKLQLKLHKYNAVTQIQYNTTPYDE